MLSIYIVPGTEVNFDEIEDFFFNHCAEVVDLVFARNEELIKSYNIIVLFASSETCVSRAIKGLGLLRTKAVGPNIFFIVVVVFFFSLIETGLPFQII